ncbi:MAG: protein kinase [Chloroflexi bacterium]|nr:protein kinase [Chloroflexota bacterium]
MKAPESIGRYEVIKELDIGGMAIVYLALDPRVKRQVAIKVLMPTLARNEHFLQRFVREAETIAQLEHPAIVPLYDFGDEDDGLYLVMRYMPGGSLHTRLEERRYSVAETAAFIQRIGSALSLAHKRGIVHRDLKPGNVLFDDQEQPYLADFGIAKVMDETMTATRQQMGSPVYMSPEQIDDPKQVDYRSDIYALGVMLFELLSGQRPFSGNTPHQLMFARFSQPIPHIHEINSDLPAAWDTVIQRAMAREKEARYQSVEEFVADVAAVADGREPITPPIPTTITPTHIYPTAEESVNPPVNNEPELPPTATRPPEISKPIITPYAGGIPQAEQKKQRSKIPFVIIGGIILGIIFLFLFVRNGDEPELAATPLAAVVVQTDTATPTVTPSPTKTPTPTFTPSIPPSQTPSATPRPTDTPWPSPTFTVTPDLLSLTGIIRSAVNVRYGPGTGYTAVAVARPDDVVTVLEQIENGEWVHVTLADGTSGWLAAEFVDMDTAADIPIAQTTPTLPPQVNTSVPTAVPTTPPVSTNPPASGGGGDGGSSPTSAPPASTTPKPAQPTSEPPTSAPPTPPPEPSPTPPPEP